MLGFHRSRLRADLEILYDRGVDFPLILDGRLVLGCPWLNLTDRGQYLLRPVRSTWSGNWSYISSQVTPGHHISEHIYINPVGKWRSRLFIWCGRRSPQVAAGHCQSPPVIGDVVPEEISTVTTGHQKHIAGHCRLPPVIGGSLRSPRSRQLFRMACR